MATELGEVLAVLHRAPRLESFEAEGEWFLNFYALNEYIQDRSDQNRVALGRSVRVQTAGMAIYTANEDDSPPEPDHVQAWFVDGLFDAQTGARGASTWRVTTNHSETVAPNESELHHWTDNQSSTSVRHIESSRYPTGLGPVVDGAQLCGDFEFAEPIEVAEHAGRSCWHVTATRRPGSGPLGHGMLESFPGSSLEAWVDQETGVLLRCVGTHTRKIFELNLSRFEPNVDIADSIFDERRPDDHPMVALEEFLGPVPAPGFDEHDPLESFFVRQEQRNPLDDLVATGPPPDDEDDARIDVGLACERVFTVSDDGAAMPYVQGGENLGPVTKAARAAFAAPDPTVVQVAQIKFLHRDEAAVSVVIEHTSGHLPNIARVLRIDGEWKVAREFIARLYAMRGIILPDAP